MLTFSLKKKKRGTGKKHKNYQKNDVTKASFKIYLSKNSVTSSNMFNA